MERISEKVLRGECENALLPFFWQHEGYTDELSERIKKIRESGCRAFCVESRPFEDFCGEKWWPHMRVILEEAQKLNMQVWILDDVHFPTGYACGAVKKFPALRRWSLRQKHLDVMGTCNGAKILKPKLDNEENIVAVNAFRRGEHDEVLYGEAISIDIAEDSPFIWWDIPEGCWRIFFVIKTRIAKENYIDMLTPEGAQALIDAVYEPHYRHFPEFFGNTLAGFFSDEPTLGAPFSGNDGSVPVFYYRLPGQPGICLPWNDRIVEMMREEGIENPENTLPLLWYDGEGNKEADIRLAYMNAVTNLWKDNFSFVLGNWCRSHGVKYIGHIIEDMNGHCTLGCSGGHYFRSLAGQDMSGIDIVLHQVMPGMGDYRTAASVSGGCAEPDFYHYTLAHMASSLARITPRMHGLAMCENFGAFGWAEGAPFMKWLMDFSMVRGINRFVPHAFTDKYPDPDCPPHFDAKGHDPQFSGFTKLMEYVNKVCTLTANAERVTDGAILYYGEQRWMDPDAMPTDVPAKILYDACIDYDILPADALGTAVIHNGLLIVNGHKHNFLAVPASKRYPPNTLKTLRGIMEKGVPVFFVGTEEKSLPGECIQEDKLVQSLFDRNLAWNHKTDAHFLRISHWELDGGCKFVYFFNESCKKINTWVCLPESGKYLSADLLNGVIEQEETMKDSVKVELEPGESRLLLFNAVSDAELARYPRAEQTRAVTIPQPEWKVSLRRTGDDNGFSFYKRMQKLEDLTGKQGIPDFSGEAKYETGIRFTGKLPGYLCLGEVGLTAHLFVNGKDMGMRITAPYRWNISEAVREGDNAFTVVTANTLVHEQQDDLSRYMVIPPSGLLGPVSLQYTE